MNSQESPAKKMKLTVNLRDGTRQELVENVTCGPGDVVDLKKLSQSIQSVQKKSNAILTELVDQERATTQSTKISDDEAEEGGEDDEEDNKIVEPPKKKQKRWVHMMVFH